MMFAVLLALHFFAVSVGWNNGNLPGCEFRQTQTAISAQAIQRENNFSLAYPTPVLGKPWAVPMEFPLYQWTVVALSNSSGLTLTSSGRAVSVACFYLTLPAFYLLLARLGLGRSGRFIVVGFFLSCPLYIFYARAFLIETMALMFGAWYLVALIAAMQTRKIPWLILAMAAGAFAGLVKVTTFMLFLIPALAWSLGWLWKSWTQTDSNSRTPFIRTLGWLTAIHALPFIAATAWVRFSDHVKLENPAGAFLSSGQMAAFNFGKNLHLDPAIWALHGKIIFHEIAQPGVVIAAALVAVVFGGRWRTVIAACTAVFVTVQLIFPGLYAWHEYYYVAGGAALLIALGLALAAAFEASVLPRGVLLLLIVICHAAQVRTYWTSFYPIQKAKTTGISGLALALRQLTEPDDVLLIAGDDWSSITPYFAERRALMLSSGTEHNHPLIAKAFAQLQGERVTTLILKGEQRTNQELIDFAAATFDLDPLPTLVWEDTWVYFHHQLRNDIIDRYRPTAYTGVTLAPETQRRTQFLAGKEYRYSDVWPKYRSLFNTMNPRPVRFFSATGPGTALWNRPGRPLQFSVHPQTRLWFKLGAGEHHLKTELELIPSAYEGLSHEEATDGVELIATVINPAGLRKELRRIFLNPRDVPADRAPRPIDWHFTFPEAGELEIAVLAGPENNPRRDWAAIGPITID
jgi:hypothetical protein